ncbi:hypothetical protein [Nostoc sp. PA-18-2419]|uniref:hypothetical protein n=1 Tax=Nostoc sp. PA-18-2419 TaxID=2575443 RepID=UPI001108D382|nr:hypothetical protein [Nostoc sp. PA-18-2419]
MNIENTNNFIERVQAASDICGKELANFVEYIGTVDPGLDFSQRTMVAAIIINQLPSAFQTNPQMLAQLKTQCQTIKR